VGFEAELTLPASGDFVSLLQGFVDDTCARGLSAESCARLAQAAQIGFQSIIGQALALHSATVRVVARCKPHVFELSLIERGLPVDEKYARRDPRWNEIVAHVDDARWIMHGVAGSELRLTVHRDDVPQPAAPAPAPSTVPLAPEQEYTIRRFVPEDGPGVAQCFYEAWGYHYVNKAVYDPARFAELNASGTVVSFVAIAQDGEVAGHYALRPYAGGSVAEGGYAVIRHAHRGRELVEKLRSAAEAAAPSLGLHGLYFEPVTDHVFTQRLNEKLGAHVCAVSLGLEPTGFTQPGMELSVTHQRQSVLLYAKALRATDVRTIYAPPHHRAMTERIFSGFGLPLIFGDATTKTSGDGALHVVTERASHIGTIEISSVGPHTVSAALQALADLKAQHLGAIYVRLPLNDPAAPALCDAFEKDGCFFSGVEPWLFSGADALRLQYVAKPLDLSQLSIFSPFARELLDYVASAMPTIIR
jgi:hypothetical protein